MECVEIAITGLRVYAHHGVMSQETAVGNEFVINVNILYPAQDAIENDNLDATLNYATAIDLIRETMRTPSALLEHAAGRIRKALLHHFPLIRGGTVQLCKPYAPVGAQIESVSVKLNLR